VVLLATVAAGLALGSDGTSPVRADGEEIVGVVWQWRATLLNDGIVMRPDDPSRYTLELGADGRAAVRADCNRGSGPYTIMGDRIDFGALAITAAACIPPSLGSLFTQQLSQASRYFTQDGDLFFALESDRGFMRLSRAAESGATGGATVIGVEWRWQVTQMNDGTAITPPDPSRYTLMLMADGRAAIRADCNTGNGPYTLTGNRIDLGPFAITLAACPPGSLDTRYLQQMDAAVIYFVRDGDLYLELQADGGTMRFARAGASTAMVTGVVTYRERIALPPDAVVIVRLEDTSRADAPATVIGEQVIDPMGRQVPIPFAVSYNPAQINQSGRYTLRARIEDAAGSLLWTNTQAYPVITGGNPTSDIEIVVMRVG
jgi:uncharacterized lipoprotein YbaY/heat shock protein HslJ